MSKKNRKGGTEATHRSRTDHPQKSGSDVETDIATHKSRWYERLLLTQ
jgi:hypothetical protein